MSASASSDLSAWLDGRQRPLKKPIITKWSVFALAILLALLLVHITWTSSCRIKRKSSRTSLYSILSTEEATNTRQKFFVFTVGQSSFDLLDRSQLRRAVRGEDYFSTKTVRRGFRDVRVSKEDLPSLSTRNPKVRCLVERLVEDEGWAPSWHFDPRRYKEERRHATRVVLRWPKEPTPQAVEQETILLTSKARRRGFKGFMSRAPLRILVIAIVLAFALLLMKRPTLESMKATPVKPEPEPYRELLPYHSLLRIREAAQYFESSETRNSRVTVQGEYIMADVRGILFVAEYCRHPSFPDYTVRRDMERSMRIMRSISRLESYLAEFANIGLDAERLILRNYTNTVINLVENDPAPGPQLAKHMLDLQYEGRPRQRGPLGILVKRIRRFWDDPPEITQEDLDRWYWHAIVLRKRLGWARDARVQIKTVQDQLARLKVILETHGSTTVEESCATLRETQQALWSIARDLPKPQDLDTTARYKRPETPLVPLTTSERWDIRLNWSYLT